MNDTTALAEKPQGKITYTSTGADLEEFHRQYDRALTELRGRLGSSHQLLIGGKPVSSSKPPLVDLTPSDKSVVLGKFAQAAPSHVKAAIKAAKEASVGWGRSPWRERLKLMRRAAQIIRERKYELAAVMSLEVGKSRMEAMGEVEESADLIDYYSSRMEEENGYEKPMKPMAPGEKTVSLLRPYGVFAVIAPFNFPFALSTGMTAGALIGGNSVIFKPSQDTPWTGVLLGECYVRAGLPAGVFNVLTGRSSVMGDELWRSHDVDGIAFTGSKDVGYKLLSEGALRGWPRPVIVEMGGKNAAVVTESADLDLAAEGIMRSAFGLQGQKCSACSRVYVEKKVEREFTGLLIEKTKKIKIGDPSDKDVFFGPVINEKAVKTFEAAVREAARGGGKILWGGKKMAVGALARGFYVEPTIAKLPLKHKLNFQELFVPFVAINAVADLEEAIAESNKSEYGLTAGIFTGKPEEIERFFDEVQAGVCYANRRGGATTGAWPGVNSFGGWKASGSTGKNGLGPYYVAQFMREQSRLVAG